MSALIGFAEFLSIGWLWTMSIGQVTQTLCTVRPSDRLDRFWRACARVHQEVWLFAPPGILFLIAEASSAGHWWIIPFNVFNLIMWWRSRNWPEDNRWKRRGKKARDAVKEVTGRLVVVPAAGATS